MPKLKRKSYEQKRRDQRIRQTEKRKSLKERGFENIQENAHRKFREDSLLNGYYPREDSLLNGYYPTEDSLGLKLEEEQPIIYNTEINSSFNTDPLGDVMSWTANEPQVPFLDPVETNTSDPVGCKKTISERKNIQKYHTAKSFQVSQSIDSVSSSADKPLISIVDMRTLTDEYSLPKGWNIGIETSNSRQQSDFGKNSSPSLYENLSSDSKSNIHHQCTICKKEFKTNFGLQTHVGVAHK